MNRYQFEKIEKHMAKQFGTIRRGQEDMYNLLFYTMEGNMLKVIRKNPSIRESDVKTAMFAALHQINGYVNGGENDSAEFETDGSRLLKHAILSAFDPYTNPEILPALCEDWDSPENQKKYWRIPVQVILRSLKSVDFWNKNFGTNGYIHMLEDEIGKMVKDDGKMNYTVGGDMAVLNEEALRQFGEKVS